VETNDLVAKLTKPQREAVMHIDGPMLILAGPGSGKTRVITHRVAYLIKQGVAPYHILALTFTNKAAEEMRQRLVNLRLPGGSTICTFHSLAARLLREFCALAELPRDFSIYDEADQKAALRDALKALELDKANYPVGQILARISNSKNDLETPEQFADRQSDFRGKMIAKIYAAYQKQLIQNAALDFDDLLMKLALLLGNQGQWRDQLNDRYRYVLVDEYQDTNHCQYLIARGLSLNHRNLCVTGDPDQSIYGWRGANINNILMFEKDYADAKVVRLEENFRSTPEVLYLADQLIRSNLRRKQKKLFTGKASGTMPELITYIDQDSEAGGMIEWIKSCRAEGMEYRDMAVFYRVNSLSRVLEEALIKEGIAYQVVRGVQFFQRREIKDMLGYLRFLINPADQVAFKRIINQPRRGIGNTTVNRLLAYSDQSGKDIWQSLLSADEITSLGNGPKKKIKKFVGLILALQKQMQGPVKQIMKVTYEQSGLEVSLAGDENASANVDELISSAAHYDELVAEPSLAEYLQQIALMSDADAYDNEAGAVSLMTLHAAKGLEFPAVLIVAVEDGLMPHTRSSDNEAELEEERRLLFVGMTRAEEKLRLSCARNRTVQGKTSATIRSRFLRDLNGLSASWSQIDEDYDDPDENDCDSDSFEDYKYESEEACFVVGQLVRHPRMGLGRIQEILPSSHNYRVVIQFNSGMRKTISLNYVNLEIVGT